MQLVLICERVPSAEYFPQEPADIDVSSRPLGIVVYGHKQDFKQHTGTVTGFLFNLAPITLNGIVQQQFQLVFLEGVVLQKGNIESEGNPSIAFLEHIASLIVAALTHETHHFEEILQERSASFVLQLAEFPLEACHKVAQEAHHIGDDILIRVNTNIDQNGLVLFRDWQVGQ